MEHLIIDHNNKTVIIKKSCPIGVIGLAINTFSGTGTKIIFKDKGVTFKI
jgi:hypothetical protein